MFRNAKVIGEKIDGATYRRQSAKRGDAGYVVSRSDLMDIAACPHKWLMSAGLDDDATDATQWGSLLDLLVLSGDVSKIAIVPETYADSKTGELKPWIFSATVCKEWKKANADKLILKKRDMDKATKAAELIMNHPVAGPMLHVAQHQVMVTAEWHDDATQLIVPVKGLIDFVPTAEAIGDLKTANDASMSKWQREIDYRGYLMQAAMYLDLYNAATNGNMTKFLHVIQESVEPYEVCTRRLSNDLIEIGRAQYRAALRKYCLCLAEKNWPGYDAGDGWTEIDALPYMVIKHGMEPVKNLMETWEQEAKEEAKV